MQKYSEQKGLPTAPIGAFLDLGYLEEALKA
jgi:hypothetical protein